MQTIYLGVSVFIITGLVGWIASNLWKEYKKMKHHISYGCGVGLQLTEINNSVEELIREVKPLIDASNITNTKIDVLTIKTDAIGFALKDENGLEKKLTQRLDELATAYNLKQSEEGKPTIKFRNFKD